MTHTYEFSAREVQLLADLCRFAAKAIELHGDDADVLARLYRGFVEELNP